MLEDARSPSIATTYIAPYYNLFSGVCTVQYRQTNNNTILKRVSSDVATVYPSNNFQPYRVLLVTYICPDNTFQMALATNGKESFAVMNYERLTRDPMQAGMNENECGSFREFFPSFRGSSVAMALNVTGVPGRHVYNLTTKGCFQPVFGVRNARDSSVYTRDTFNYKSANLLALRSRSEEISSLHFNELVSGRETPVSLVLQSLPNQVGTSIAIYYGIFQGSSSSTSLLNLYTSNLFILEGTSKSTTFQYGNISIPLLSSSTICKRQVFDQAMESSPSIKISARVSSYLFKNFVFVWLKNVTNNGFTVCSREIISYSGDRNVSINYIAATNGDSNIQEVNNLIYPASSQTQRCVIKKFKDIFMKVPDLYISVEAFGDGDAPMISWVKSVTQTQAEICLKSTRNEQHKIHMVISGEISACTNYNCPDHLECQLTTDLKPYCGCISSCAGKEERKFCGSDFMNYRSMCELHQRHCQKHGNSSKTNITIKHYGECQGK